MYSARKSIYVHDGSTVQSLADGRVRKFIHDSLNLSASTVCFTTLNEELNEVYSVFSPVMQTLVSPTPTGATGLRSTTTGATLGLLWTYQMYHPQR